MLFISGIASLVAAAIGPRNLWWALRSWAYRDPAANEPSDAAYDVERVVLILFAVFALVVGVSAFDDPSEGAAPEAFFVTEQPAQDAVWGV